MTLSSFRSCIRDHGLLALGTWLVTVPGSARASDANQGAETEQDAAAEQGVEVAPEARSTRAPEDLVGTYLLRLDVATDSIVPVFGRSRFHTVQTMVATIEQTPEGLVQHHDVCNLEGVRGTGRASLGFTQDYVDAVPSKDYPVELTVHPDQPWGYTADFGPIHLGWDPSKADSLPQEREDPSVWDADGDGNPGITLLVDVPLLDPVRVYMVQTEHMVLEGTVQGPDRVEGLVRMETLEQRTIGASNILFTPNPRIEPNGEHRSFSMERVPDGTTCSDVIP